MVLRTTLKSISEAFEGIDKILKCHRSYIVNLHKVSRFSGNAQGYKLHFREGEELVPVSRALNSTIKSLFLDSR